MSDQPDISHSKSSLACCRKLTYSSEKGEVDIVVRIWTPYKPDESNHEHHDYQCDFEIIGFNEKIARSCRGADSMQALFTSLLGVDHYLKRFRSGLSWMGIQYDELPFVVRADALRRAQIQQIVDA